MFKILANKDLDMSKRASMLKAREQNVKKYICSCLEKAVTELVESTGDRSLPVETNELTTNVVTCIEAIFIHKLRDTFMDRVTGVFGSETGRQPEPNFWTLILSISHKHQILALNESQYLTTDIGRSRGWIRLVLNDCLFWNFIEALRRDSKLITQFYEKEAFLKDSDACAVLKKQAIVLSEYAFGLSVNSSLLNKWTSTPLAMAGLWIPPTAITPEAVVQGCDVAGTIVEMPHASVDRDLEAAVFERIVRSSPRSSRPSSTGGDSPKPTPVGSFSREPLFLPRHDSNISLSSATVEIQSGIDRPSSVASVEVETQTMDSDFSDENRSTNRDLGEGDKDRCETYEGLLTIYSADQGLSRTPVRTLDLNLIGTEAEENTNEEVVPFLLSNSTLSPKVISGFEVVQPEVTPKPSKVVSKVLSKIAVEDGLDAQDYTCRDCRRPIGIIFGEARFCHVSGYYYCEDCHDNEQMMIPSRMIYNWDFGLYPISSSSALLLKQIAANAVVNVMDLNPRLYSFVEELRVVKDFRSQLVYANAYLATCKSDAKDELRKRLWPREYLYEHVHLYSLSDISQVALGSLIATLKKTVEFCTAHVLKCLLCQSRGFICELCKNPNPIFPFEIHLTHRCTSCGLVCHLACVDRERSCTRCERIQRRNAADRVSGSGGR